MILSYGWLVERNFDIHSRKHGLMGHVDDCMVWIPGILENPNSDRACQPVSVRAIPTKPGLRALDLFCGRKSSARVLEKFGFSVETLDIDPRRNPSILVDILNWDYKQYPPGYFHLITASPPCTEYSLAMNKRPRNLEFADQLVQKTLEIVEYFSPEKWWIETPKTNILARRDFMQKYPYVIATIVVLKTPVFKNQHDFLGVSI